MAFKDHIKGDNDSEAAIIQSMISKYGLPLFLFYVILGIAAAAIDYLRSFCD